MQIRKIFMSTSKYNELLHFYNHDLELEAETATGSFMIRCGKTQIHFNKANDSSHPFYHFAINIPYNKVEEGGEWIRKHAELIWIEDYQSEVAEFSNWKARSVYFIDPGGNIVELIGRKNFREDSPGGFHSGDLLAVSEIGIVYPAADFHIKVEALKKKLDLDYFSKQPPLPSFVALGNDEGLFILAPENRPWYPTKINSGIFPLKVEIIIRGKTYIEEF